MKRRSILAIQLLGTLAILAFVPTNFGKLAAFFAWWAITFRRIRLPETILYVVLCCFFSVMNVLSLRQGIFAFSRPDILGMPVYEFFMWAFYILHTLRMIGGQAPVGHRQTVWVMAILYSVTFGTFTDSAVLLAVSGVLLLAGLTLFHKPLDLIYVGYMVLIGAAVEYTGVLSGEWYYPDNPPSGVPLWFITLWGGVGLLLRRLVLPILARFDHSVTTPVSPIENNAANR
jgi:hypothetical protein